jgi:hypothetical protein
MEARGIGEECFDLVLNVGMDKLNRLGARPGGQLGAKFAGIPKLELLDENKILASSVGRHVWRGKCKSVELRWPYWRVRSHHRTRPLGASNLSRRRWTFATVGRLAGLFGTSGTGT